MTLEYLTDAPPAAIVDDLARLQARSYAPVGLHAWPAREIASAMSTRTGLSVIARHERGDLCGFLLASVVDGDAEILSIAVDPAYRRQKIGQRLVEKLVSIQKSESIECVILEVATTNDIAINFYEILRFAQIGIRRNYYLIDGQRIDARVMKKCIV